MARKKLIIGIILLIIAVLIIKEIVAYWSYFVVGAHLGVFGINNKDSINHSANIQVFGSSNKLLLNETYDLGPSQTLYYPEKGWKDVYEREKLFPSGDYKIILTLDGNVTKTYQGVMDTWSVVDFDIHRNGNIDIQWSHNELI